MLNYSYDLPYDAQELRQRLELSAKRFDLISLSTENIYTYRLSKKRLFLAYNPRFFTTEHMFRVYFRASVSETGNRTKISGSFSLLLFNPLYLIAAFCVYAAVCGHVPIALLFGLPAFIIYILVHTLIYFVELDGKDRVFDFIKWNLLESSISELSR